MKRAKQRQSRAFTLTVAVPRPRAPALAGALRGKHGGAHGKTTKALRRAARVALRQGQDES
jgi:hypothetical protein